MRVKLPGRSLMFQHQKLQSEDSPVKPTRMTGLSAKAKSCKHISFASDDFDTLPTSLFGKRPEMAPVSKQASTGDSRSARMTNSKLKTSSNMQTSFRNLFSSREERDTLLPDKPITKNKPSTTKPTASKSRRQKSVASVSTRPKLVRIAEEETTPTRAPRSLDFDLPAPPTNLRRAQSAPQNTRTSSDFQLDNMSAFHKESIRQLDLFLADMSGKGRANEVTVREVPPVLTKPKVPLRNPYENLPHLSSSRRKVTPINKPRNTHDLFSVRATLSTAPPVKSNVGSLKSLDMAYKSIMVEFGDDTSEATTGW